MIRRLLLCLLAGFAPATLAAQSTFDLAGPDLRVAVTHEGVTLPISQVPNLEPGDRVSVAALLPPDQEARYLLVAAFLRGATNPPPKSWFARAETWKNKRLELTVPEGARQLVLFLVPETGGDYSTVMRAVRGQPGVFTRAAQDLSQAASDRARLDVFLNVIRRQPAGQAPDAIPPTLTRSLAIRVDTQCLDRRPELQAACLTRGSDPVVLSDRTRDSLTETLTGAPVDIAIQLSNTPAGGYGYYSPYIGVLRDVARLFGAFRSAQFQYIPTLARIEADRVGTLLNAAPSFRDPKSVLVVPMPPVEQPVPPTLRAVEPRRAICATRRDLLLAVTGAPAIYATAHAHDMELAAPGANGRVSLPVRADPERGGYVLAGAPPEAERLNGDAEAVLRGKWGFASFEGPRFRLQSPHGRTWQAGDEVSLVVGRENQLDLQGGAASCVSKVELDDGKNARAVEWAAATDERLSLKLPLARTRPGPVTLLVSHYGQDAPARITLKALAEGSRVDALALHAGDATATLSGLRLDLVETVTIDGVAFRPGILMRDGQVDRLTLQAPSDAASALVTGQEGTARVALSDGRKLNVRFEVAPPRPAVSLISRSVSRPAASAPVRIALADEDAIPHDAKLTFSIRATGATRFGARDTVEVATNNGATATLRSGEGLTLQDAQVAVISFEPGALLGASAHGVLQFRLIREGVAGEWMPLGTLVRLPALTAVRCAVPARSCTLHGDKLFLLSAAAGNPRFAPQAEVPDGFTSESLSIPGPAGRELYLKLRDSRDVVATVPRG